IDEAAKLAQRVQREPRGCDHWQGRCGVLRHPRRQQNAAAIRLLDHKVKATPVNESLESEDAFSSAGMMRIMDDNFKRMFLRTMSRARPAAAKAIWRAAIGLALVENGWRVLFTRTSDL